MTLPKVCIARLFALLTAMPAFAQTGPHAAADEVLSALAMRLDGTAREFRAIAPFGRDEFLAASFSLDGSATIAALHVVTADGRIGAAVPLPKPLNYPGSRIDGLVPAGGAVIGIGHLAGGPEDRRGWIVRIEPDLTVSAEAVLPIAADALPINYYYGGVLDNQGRLIVAGRSDQPNFAGLGVRFGQTAEGQLQVVVVHPDGAGMQAGLRAGDIVLRANGQDLRGLDLQQAMSALAGPPDALLEVEIDRPGAGPSSLSVARKEVTGLAFGVVAALDPLSLEIIQAPKLVDHGTYRAGLQDIGRTPSGQIVGVGWWESLPPGGGMFDKAWVVGLDANLDKQNDGQFGAGGNHSIAHRVHARPDGRLLAIGTLNTGPDAVAFASELTLDGGGDAPAELTSLREHSVGPGLSDVFRGVATLREGTTIVGGAFRSDNAPRFQASAVVLGSDAPPVPLFASCAQSYVWDMAANAAGSLAVAGYCMDAQGARRAALMWSPPREFEAGAMTLASAPRAVLTPEGLGQGFELQQPDHVLVFVPAGAPGVLSLSDASGHLVDFASVDAGKAGLLAANLAPGRYVVGWASDGSGEAPRIDVVMAAFTAAEPGQTSSAALTPEVEQALTLLGYSAARQQQHTATGPQSMALTREIAAYQLSRNLSAVGHVDLVTEVALAVDGAFKAEAKGREAAEMALRLAREGSADTLPSRFGPVRGYWRGDAFAGAASRGGLSYAGEWQVGQGGLAMPSGFGVLDNLTARESFAGMFRYGAFSGLGVTDISRDPPTRIVGTFDDQSRFTKGAVYENGGIVASGIFAPGERDLVRDVRLTR